MDGNAYDVLNQKYQEGLSQGIDDSEMVEYLSDNSDEDIQDILDFVNSK